MTVEALITKLNVELFEKQQEIRRLNNIIEKNKYTVDELDYIKELENIINKTVEYIEKSQCHYGKLIIMTSTDYKELMKLLKGKRV